MEKIIATLVGTSIGRWLLLKMLMELIYNYRESCSNNYIYC
ncbi:hypothetical protein Gogos_020089 [Gossypium gossypioides]|uniref:Uncharacterized protein n=1 Tax=Gossypium gossypioides TaxID=34282 RepID=A0A7J9D272_GOSGO|nr:hypothetical protein [Gossypium gossypioides]